MHSKQLADQWKQLIVGQDHAIDRIVPYIIRFRAGLSAASHPIGNFFLLGPTGTGKALPLDELVATPNGFVKNGTLVPGSLVVGKNGKSTKVEAVYPQGLVDIFEVTFADGRTIECCGDHLWQVYNKHWEPKPSSKIFSTLDIKDFIEKNRELHIPLCSPIEYAVADLPIDPYLLGALIGDGHLGKSFSFTNVDTQTIQKVDRVMSASANGSSLVQYDEYSYGITMLNNPHRNQFTLTEDDSLRGCLRQLGLYEKRSWEKFIPSQYQLGSVDQRFALIQGMMDTDGTAGQNGTISYCTTSEQLAKDFQLLVWSVGGYAKITPIKKYYKYKGQKKLSRPVFIVNIRHGAPEQFFSLDRKIELAKRNVQYRNRLRLKIQSVEFIGQKEAQCITVSNEDALYVAKSYVVTHNTRTAETLAEVLHGDEKKVLKVDCGEYHLEHETAKLIGAPPGYLGHKDTQPLLSQARVNGITSEKCDISIVLFDEIEKAHNSFWRLLLGMMDKATLRLGDNQSVSFEKCIIFMSSNIGAMEMADAINGGIGFPVPKTLPSFDRIGMKQMSKKFPPEFPNRIDETITYHILDDDSLRAITALEIKKIENQILNRLGVRTFHLVYGRDVIDFITKEGTSQQYGAREIKRTITRYLLNPLSDDFLDETIKPGCHVYCRVEDNKIIWDVTEPQFVIGPDGSIIFNDITEKKSYAG